MMKVIVRHANYNPISGAVLDYTDVAEVNAWHTEDINEALEYAYRWTNNLSGSWSIKLKDMTLSDGTVFDNGDYNDNVTVLVPLRKGMGLRSTSMSDRMVLNGKTYKVSAIGFTELELEEAY
jgi:hypothetical protein